MSGKKTLRGVVTTPYSLDEQIVDDKQKQNKNKTSKNTEGNTNHLIHVLFYVENVFRDNNFNHFLIFAYVNLPLVPRHLRT